MAQAGSAVRVRVSVYDVDTEALTDPSVGVFITIVDEIGTVKVDGLAMTKIGTGRYRYIWQSAITDRAGLYEVSIKDNDGTYQYVSDRSVFVLT